MKKGDPKVLKSALSAIRNNCEDAGVSVDETELMEALIAAASKAHPTLSSVNWNKTVARYCQRDGKGNVGLGPDSSCHAKSESENNEDDEAMLRNL